MIDNGVGDALHTYQPDDTGRCTSGWHNSRGEWVECGSRQRSSVLHDDCESDFRQHHDHGGGDCMCFEDEGPSFHEAMRMHCYPTPDEIAEQERRAEAARRRRRRVFALSNGGAITRIATKVKPDDPDLDRKVARIWKLHRWGVNA